MFCCEAHHRSAHPFLNQSKNIGQVAKIVWRHNLTESTFYTVRLGLVAGVIAPVVIGKIGPAAARHWFLTGDRIDAAEALRAAIPAGAPIEVEVFEVKYPQGAEKMLISALLGREVPSGGLPLNVGALVVNVATSAEIGRLLMGFPDLFAADERRLPMRVAALVFHQELEQLGIAVRIVSHGPIGRRRAAP